MTEQSKIIEIRLNQLIEHPAQRLLFKPLEGDKYQEFLSNISRHGVRHPIIVSERTGQFVVCDGHQRLRAARDLELLTIPAQVEEFADEDDEVRTLIGENVQRRQLSREELAHVVKFWLTRHSNRVNRWIARDLGVSKNTVEERRLELESVGQIDQHESLVGEDGKHYPRHKAKPAKVEKLTPLERPTFDEEDAEDEAEVVRLAQPLFPKEDEARPEPLPPFPINRDDQTQYSDAYGKLLRIARELLSIPLTDYVEAFKEDKHKTVTLRSMFGSIYSLLGRVISEHQRQTTPTKSEQRQVN